MITYNEAKQLLNQGIFPCLIRNGTINYIISYNDNELSCTTSFYKASYTAENENSELSIQFINDGGGGMAK